MDFGHYPSTPRCTLPRRQVKSSICSGHSGVNASSKLGGRSAEGDKVWGVFLFCDLEMAYFSEFWGAKFKVFFIVSSLSEAQVGSVANFGFSSKAMNKIHLTLNAVIGRGRLILVCYIRKYVIILGIFPLGDVSPASPAWLTPVRSFPVDGEVANLKVKYICIGHHGTSGSLYPLSIATQKSSSVWKRCSNVGLSCASFFQQSNMTPYRDSGQSVGWGCRHPVRTLSTACWLLIPSHAYIVIISVKYYAHMLE